MEKGNKSINKSMVKTIFEGNILIPLPKTLFNLFWGNQNLD
jgi:hypothetical protein